MEISSKINGYCISPSIQNIINIIDDGSVGKLNPSTASYYGMKIINEIDRFNKMMFTYPVGIQLDIRDKISYLEEKLESLKSVIKEKSGNAPVYFSDLSTDESIRNHPFVKILTGFRDRGFSIDAAIDMTANIVGVPELQIKTYVDKFKIEYPDINVGTKEYIQGQEDAKKLVTNLGKYSDVAEIMYNKQNSYLKRDNNFDVTSYMAGFCNAYQFSDQELEKLKEEGRVLSF